MTEQQMLMLLRSIFSDNRLFTVTQVSIKHNIFALTDAQGKNRFYQYSLDLSKDIIAIYNPMGELKYHRFISDYLKVAV